MLHEGETVAFGLGSASARTTCAAPREGVSAARERLAREAPAAGFAAERVKALRKGGGKGRRKGQRRAKRAQDRHPNGERDPGSRREGRDRGANVLDVPYDRNSIKVAIEKSMTCERFEPDSLYGDGLSGERIAELLATAPLEIEKRITY